VILPVEYSRPREEDTFFTVWARNEHSMAMIEQGRLAEAEVVLRQTMPIGRRVLGASSPLVGWTTLDLAHTLLWQGKREETVALLLEAIDAGLYEGWAERLPADPALASLRDDPRFVGLTERVRAQLDAAR
jgi:hypothetical protein